MRLLKTLLLCLLMLCCFGKSFAQNKEADFKKACDAIMQGMTKKKLSILNALISNSTGVYVTYKPGLEATYKTCMKLDGQFPFSFEYFDTKATDIPKETLQYGRLPTYNCKKEAWSKKGFIADSLHQYKPISTIYNLNTEKNKVSKKELDAIETMEKNSRKVIFTGAKGTGIVFYLACVNHKWYLSVIDRASADCEM